MCPVIFFSTNKWMIFLRCLKNWTKKFALACKQFSILCRRKKKSIPKIWHKPEKHSIWKLLLMWLIKTSWHLSLLTASLSHEWSQWLVHLKKLTKKLNRVILPSRWVGHKVRNTVLTRRMSFAFVWGILTIGHLFKYKKDLYIANWIE